MPKKRSRVGRKTTTTTKRAKTVPEQECTSETTETPLTNPEMGSLVTTAEKKEEEEDTNNSLTQALVQVVPLVSGGDDVTTNGGGVKIENGDGDGESNIDLPSVESAAEKPPPTNNSSSCTELAHTTTTASSSDVSVACILQQASLDVSCVVSNLVSNSVVDVVGGVQNTSNDDNTLGIATTTGESVNNNDDDDDDDDDLTVNIPIEDPGEEFVFPPIDPEEEHVDVTTIDLITPVSSRHSSAGIHHAHDDQTHNPACEYGSKAATSKPANLDGGECSHNNLVEVIDVDDLPDTPTPSSVGDEVIEITPDNSVRGDSPEIILDRQVVDLTENGDLDNILLNPFDMMDDDGSDFDDDHLLSIWSRMSKKKKSSASGGGGGCTRNQSCAFASSSSSCEEKSASASASASGEGCSGAGQSTSSSSDTGDKLKCAICMDDFGVIVKDRQLMSTSCGHVFCSTCLKAAVTTQKKCPTCRKKQTLKNLHPIFL